MAKKQSSDFVSVVANSLKAAGYKSVADAQTFHPFTFTKNHYQDVNKLLDYYPAPIQPTLNKSEKAAQAILSKQGHNLSDLPQETQQFIHDAKVADAQAAALGHPRKKKPSLWLRTLDILSRPAYGSAEAVKEGLDKNVSGGGVLKTLEATGSGWLKGVEGKKKTTFSDVIQRAVDLHHAAARGVDQSHILQGTKQGEGHVNPWLKYGGGLASDIALDPTTYLGVGLVTKGAKGAEAVKDIERTAQATKALREAGVLTEKESSHLLAGTHVPTNISRKEFKNLSKEGKTLVKEARSNPVKRQRFGEGSAYLKQPGINGGKTVAQDLARVEKAAGLKAGELTDIAAKNAAQDTGRVLAVKAPFSKQAAKTGITLAPVGRSLAKVTPDAAVRAAQKAVIGFNNATRARAGIGDTVNLIRGKSLSSLGQHLRATSEDLSSLYRRVPDNVAHGAYTSWKLGHIAGHGAYGGKTVFGSQAGKEAAHLVTAIEDQANHINQVAKQAGLKPTDIKLPGNIRIPAMKVVKGKRVPVGFGTDPNFVKDFLKKQDHWSHPGEAMLRVQHAVYKAIETNARHEQYVKTFGHALTSGSVPKGYVKAAIEAPAFEGHVFHPDVAEAIGKSEKLFASPPELNKFFREVGRVNTAIKRSLTIYNPGFHPRTMMGEALLSYLGGMPTHAFVPSYRAAIRILHGSHRISNVESLTRKEIRRKAALEGMTPGATRNIRVGKFGNRSADELRHAYVSSGIKTGLASHDLAIAASGISHHARKVSSKVDTVAETTEDLGRMAHFVYLLRTSKARNFQEAVDDAAKKVLKYHLDYTATTALENKVARTAIPFYKWMRLSAPLMIDVLMHNPGRILTLPKSLSALSKGLGYDAPNIGFMPAGADGLTPDYLTSHGAYPLFGKHNHYFDPQNLFPVVGALTLGEGQQGRGPVIQKLNPLITTAASLALSNPTNKEGTEVTAPSYVKKNPWRDYRFFTGQLPQTRYANELINPSDPEISRLERTALFAGNPGLVSVTHKKLRSAAYGEKKKAQTNLKQYQKR